MKYTYLIHLQYLGFRFHGWQKQVNAKSIQEMLNKTLATVLNTDQFKTMGASRTDSMVSANHHLSQVVTTSEINLESFTIDMNYNLPQDIKLLKIEPIQNGFNILNTNKSKEYRYYFSFGEKTHPYCAPFITNIIDKLDIDLMVDSATVFEGEHNFIQYCYRGNEKKQFIRSIQESRIYKNTEFSASFFPTSSYCYKIVGSGFLRNQIRYMMGALFSLGLGQVSFEDIKTSLSLENTKDYPIGIKASASGLHLFNSEFSAQS